ncbi:NADH-dependent flavin oxidoreductase [Schizosaccharomyces cryophilus OY26]|uniref:NADH-dependent flavin oxidoreductase n=1 Tax=Schizosaccharomyces cryophilus (strain OY26 / ATCC MYA-4695 / CBS 11777 / NBRC 106824 / NRRL Y48691) TaxID=653667 RepID=S9VZB0_SCHCR|nr:NADH-dependent flavin oxidoreductase [Schizosaccharomyces cryophilus OY26]EPY51529.1 NADH-dependent flavin oxidoreductase [Schizosaccharomyces cryophilus OY26]
MRPWLSLHPHPHHLFPVFSSYPTVLPFRASFSSSSSSLPSSSSHHAEFRALMRRFAQPVVILSSGFPNGHQAAMTASSFTPVSLSPNPVVSFNLKIPSRTASAIVQSRRVVVHLLSSSILRHSQWASILSKPNHPTVFPSPSLSSVQEDISSPPSPSSSTADTLSPSEVSFSKEGVPHLLDSLGLLHCSILHSIPVQDHLLFVANVDRVEHGSIPLAHSSGLVYYNRQYCSVSSI